MWLNRCQTIWLMVSQEWCRWWLGTIKFQAIVWTSVAMIWHHWTTINIFRPEKKGRHLQAPFSNAFLRIKMFIFWFRYHWSLFLGVETDDKSALVKVLACSLFSNNPLSEPTVTECQLAPQETNFREIWIKIPTISYQKLHLTILFAKCPLYSGLNVLRKILLVPAIRASQLMQKAKTHPSTPLYVTYFLQCLHNTVTFLPNNRDVFCLRLISHQKPEEDITMAGYYHRITWAQPMMTWPHENTYYYCPFVKIIYLWLVDFPHKKG